MKLIFSTILILHLMTFTSTAEAVAPSCQASGNPLIQFLPSQDPVCLPYGTPTTGLVEATITALAANANYTGGTSVSVQFAPLGGAQTANTACSAGLFSSAISCTITIDPKFVNPVMAPITYQHELYHAQCTESNCPLNFFSVNPGSNLVGYSNTASSPFSAQEIFTHYQDYLGFLSALQNAIDNCDQETATFAANWATYSRNIYNQSYNYTEQTLSLVASALSQYASDSALIGSGRSADGKFSIGFGTYGSGSTDLSSVTATLSDPSADNKIVMVEYPVVNVSGALNYAGAIAYLQKNVSRSSSYLEALPTQIPQMDVYNMMVAAGYAPAGAFDSTSIVNNFFHYDPSANPPGSMQSHISASTDLVPGPGVGQAPMCIVPGVSADSCSLSFSGPDQITGEQVGATAPTCRAQIFIQMGTVGVILDGVYQQSDAEIEVNIEGGFNIPASGVTLGVPYSSAALGGSTSANYGIPYSTIFGGAPNMNCQWADNTGGQYITLTFSVFDTGAGVYHGTIDYSGPCNEPGHGALGAARVSGAF